MILRHIATCCVPGVVCSDDQDRDFEHGTQHITVSSEFYAFHSPSKQAKSGPLNGWAPYGTNLRWNGAKRSDLNRVCYEGPINLFYQSF